MAINKWFLKSMFDKCLQRFMSHEHVEVTEHHGNFAGAAGICRSDGGNRSDR